MDRTDSVPISDSLPHPPPRIYSVSIRFTFWVKKVLFSNHFREEMVFYKNNESEADVPSDKIEIN